MTLKTAFLSGASAIAVFAATLPLQAQSNDQSEDDAATANVAGGQVVVEQEDATVDVTVPDPDVDVTQGAPVVTVEQPQPEITVTVPEPTVRVQQQAPIITVEQAQPQITVRIPEPVVTVKVPQPEVDVETGEPVVDLEQPEPVVRFVRPEPKITIEESEPQISVESAAANVDVTGAEEPEVDVSQAEPEINVEQGDDANIEMEAAEEPQVDIVDGGEAEVDVMQEQARVVLMDFNEDEQGNMSEEDRQRYEENVSDLPIFEMNREDLVGRTVATENGEEVGEIENIARRGDGLVAIIGVGGLLGMGENDVAVPLQKLVVRDEEIIVPGATEEELENMPEYNESEVEMVTEDGQSLSGFVVSR